MKKIEIYTDGGVKGNGHIHSIGCAAYVVLQDDVLICTGWTSVTAGTTNNREEMKAIINALNNRLCSHEEHITLYSDSSYCVNGINKWMKIWEKNNFLRGDETIPNKDLWEEMFKLVNFFSNLSVMWVRGHDGNKWNEHVDRLCQNKLEEYKK